MYAEYPETRSWIELFHDNKAEYEEEGLQKILGRQRKYKTTKLVDIGFLEKKKNTCKIPFIYRAELNISQGIAK